MALVLNSKQFALYHQRLSDRFRPAVLRGVHSGAARAVDYLVARTRAAPPANPGGVGTGGAVDTGNFLRGWRVLRSADGATIVNVSAHGPMVDNGRRPGSKMPPRDPLIAWIKRKLLSKAKPARGRSKPRTSSDAQRARAEVAKQQAILNGNASRKRKSPNEKPAKGDKRSKASVSADQQAARLYFPIARAIARRGLLPRKILNNDEARADILRIVEREVVAELNREMKKL